MDKDTVEKAAERLLEWQRIIGQTTRLERHEAMKAILFGLSDSARLEYQVVLNGRKIRFDFMDEDMVIEIDDGPNEKSLRKLSSIKDRQAVWILILGKGKGGKAWNRAHHYQIPTFRLFANQRACFDWIVKCP